MSDKSISLPELGWSHFFQQQLSLEEWESTNPVRVLAVHRGSLDVAGENNRQQLSLPGSWQRLAAEDRPTVGDWLLLESESGRLARMLDRKSLFKRKAAGREASVQLMAANVDTLFIVTSCNQDFNLSRLERYLALALEAGVDPALVLTKADLSDDVAAYRRQALSLNPGLAVATVNALEDASVAALHAWCGPGQTVALVGSSGVGKSTLINTLCHTESQKTAGIREDDARGRHTTTARSLHLLPGGGLLTDSPGLRELQLSDCETGVASLFEDIEELAKNCRYNNCQHQSEDGCAVKAALDTGVLDTRRLANYRKLIAEQQRNAETIAERRQRDKDFGKLVRSVKAAQKKERNGF